MKKSNKDYFREYIELLKKTELQKITKKQLKEYNQKKSYIRQYLKDHRNINLPANLSIIQPNLTNFIKSKHLVDMYEVIIETMTDNDRKLIDAQKKKMSQLLKASNE